MPPKPAATGAKKPATQAKTGAKPKAAGAKAPAKTQAKGATPAKAAEPEKKEPEKKPVVITELPLKEVDAQIVADKEGKVQASGKYALIMDENSLIARFLRHRDVNMLTTADDAEMQPERIRLALLGAVKFGKPFVLDMMETEMYEFCRERLDEVTPGLMDMLLDKQFTEDHNYMKIVKEEDGRDYSNKYDFKLDTFCFIIVTSNMAPNEQLLQRMYPVKVAN